MQYPKEKIYTTTKFTSGKSRSTSDISFPLSPHPTYIITSLLEYLESDWEMTVFPHPKAPGIAVVPPCTHLHMQCNKHDNGNQCVKIFKWQTGVKEK